MKVTKEDCRIHSARSGHYGIHVTVTHRATNEFATVYGKKPMTHSATIDKAIEKLNRKLDGKSQETIPNTKGPLQNSI
jgi:hypothetical protein